MTPSIHQLQAEIVALTRERDKWKQMARQHETRLKDAREARAPFMRELAGYMVGELRSAKYIEIHQDPAEEKETPR